ncbi:unnamed protein product, partial [Pocillopora meandrina]
LFTPEPDYSLVDAPEFPAGENSRECSSTLLQMKDGCQSHVANHLHTGILTSPATKTRPGESTLIMVKPYSDPGHNVPEENGHQRVCIHGIPLGGMNGDPHQVDCTLCERPGSRGGRALAGMIAFRRAQSKKRKSGSLPQRQKLTEEHEKMRKTTEEYDKALREFAERHQNDD